MMKIEHSLGLAGAGNMGTAIVRGCLQKGILDPEKVMVYDKQADKSEAFAAKFCLRRAKDLRELYEHSSILLLAFKPQDLAAAAKELPGDDRSERIFFSILAGTPLAKLKSHLNSGRIVRAMPNLPAKISQGLTVIASESGDSEAVRNAEILFQGCGEVMQLEEKYFDLVTAVSGSGPAYFFYMMEQMMAEAEAQGISKQQARQLAVQTALGAALLALSGTETPGELRQQVTSPGGTTAAALAVMDQNKFSAVMREAVRAAASRSRELSQS